MNLFTGEYVTLTFVVRKGGDLEEPEDPRTLLTDDEVMFWGSEPGITPHAITLGAEVGDWHEDVKATTACRHCGHGIGYDDTEKTWVAPDAGFDVENGDGIWRDICPDNDDFPNPPHEPQPIVPSLEERLLAPILPEPYTAPTEENQA